MSLVDVVRRTLQRERLATSTTRVAVALSGGPDSTVLLHVLRDLDSRGELQLAAVVHLNHRLRAEADADQQACAQVALSCGLPFIAEQVDVRAGAAAGKRSIEDAAHTLRHAFFARAARACGADVVAVGHTRDDQAETFLLRLLRGAGTRGLGAMHPRRGLVIRPLIEVSRAEVLAFARARGLTFLHDASNDDLQIPRNRVRAELLPWLRRAFNPRVAEALATEADLARADEDLLGGLVEPWVAAHVRQDGACTWSVDRGALLAAPRAVAWRALLGAMTTAAAGASIGSADVRRAWAVCLGEVEQCDLPRHRVQRNGARIVLTGRPAGAVGRPGAAMAVAPAPPVALPVPGEAVLAGTRWSVSAELGRPDEIVGTDDPRVAVVPKDKVSGGLWVRSRRPGDRLRPSAAGRRKLQDLLVDRKVPRAERDDIPLVVDAHDRIVWVAGQVVDHDFRVSDPAQAVVILRLKGVGGEC